MEKKWYRTSVVKVLLMVIFTVSVVLAAIGGSFLIAMVQQGIYIWGDAGKTYLDSESLAQNVFSSSLHILEGIQAEKKRSLAGTEDSSALVVDLEKIRDGGILTYESLNDKEFSGLGYLKDDLNNWASSGWECSVGKTIVVCCTEDGEEYYYYSDAFLRMMDQEKIQFQWDAESDEASEEYIRELIRDGDLWPSSFFDGLTVNDLERHVKYVNIYHYPDTLIVEKYSPVGEECLLDAVNNSDVWRGRLSDAYASLERTLDEVSADLAAASNLKQYQEGNTNLTYLYVDKDAGKVYTNNGEYESYGNYEESLKRIKENEGYVLIQTKLADCESDLRVGSGESPDLEAWQHTLEGQEISEDFVFAVSVDKNFPVQDSLAKTNANYNQFMGLRSAAVRVIGLAAVLFLFSVIWLTFAAGRRADDEVVHLNSFDRIFTEAAAIGVFFAWICGIALGAEFVNSFVDPLYSFSLDSAELFVFAGILGSFTALIFLWGYMSLVRRIKAKTLWKNSFLRWTLGVVRKMCSKLGELLEFFSHNTGSRIKMVLLMGGFLILQFFINGLIFSGSAFFLLVLTVVDCGAMLYFIRKAEGREQILEGLKRISEGELQYKIPTDRLRGEQKMMAEYINHIGEGLDAAVESSLKNERMKTELITNVSHDIKTPLTSIINYVDLLKRENFTDPKICGYLDILDEKAHRLKVLTEDVVEASKASSGAISLEMTDLNLIEMLHQVMGEFDEKFQERQLSLMVHLTDEAIMIRADGRRLWRVLENIFNNVVKYAMEGTRVYAETASDGEKVTFSLKNISAQPLNISAEELTERFIRGDSSRNTEGSGLGLSIARSLTELQGGGFKPYLDGDLFKVLITFPLV